VKLQLSFWFCKAN